MHKSYIACQEWNTLHKKRQIRTISALGISLILALAGDQTLYAVLPVLAASSVYPFAKVGLLLSANRFIRLLSNPIIGSLLNRNTRKKFLLLGLAFGAVSPILYAYGASSFVLFLFGRVIWGVAFSLMYITSVTMVMDITTDENRGWGSGFLQTFYFIGLAVTPLLGGFLNDVVGFKNSLFVCSILGVISLAVSWFFVDETKPDQALALKQASDSLFTARELIRQTGVRIREALQVFDKESATAFYLYMLSAFISEGVLMATISLFLVEQYGGQLVLGGIVFQAATIGGAALAYRSITSALSSPLVGWISDRISNPWLTIWFGNLSGIIGLALLALVHHPASLAISLFFIALNSGIILTGLPVLLTRKNSANKALLIGWMASSVDVGLTLAPLVSYLLLGWIPLSMLYLLGAILVATGLPSASKFAFYRSKS